MTARRARFLPRLRVAVLSALFAVPMARALPAFAADPWIDTPVATTTARSAVAADMPSRYRRVSLAGDGLAGFTGRGLARSVAGAPASELVLPLPEGGTSRFTLEDSGVLPTSLADRYPSLRSLVGRDDQGRVARIDVDTSGTLHASVADRDGAWLIRPEAPAVRVVAARGTARGARTDHLVFRKAHAPRRSRFDEAMPKVTAPALDASVQSTARGGGGQPLRTFRLAVSATSDYVTAMGGTVDDGLAGVMRTVNRLNGIFENDLGVHFELAGDNDRLVFADPATDPFWNLTDAEAIMTANVAIAARVLGRENYDVGHVLDGKRDDGLAGAFGNTCVNVPTTARADRDPGADKAAGMTGSRSPFGDAFHVDYVAHELGHQFGARHTFNLRHPQRDDNGAVAPGSGSTIMGYAGITDADIQANTDAYFHASSIGQIQSWLASRGGACARSRGNPVPAPWLDDNYPRYYTVPARTPFLLDNALLYAHPAARPTYTFEQMDFGPAQVGTTLRDQGAGPLFRSRAPASTNERTFPAMEVLLGREPLGLGDALPATGRTLNFRVTARDNLDQLAHVVSRDMTVQVVDTGRAFEVIAPVAAATVARGKPRAVRWRVAGTRAAPISCATVDVRLSTDGGETFGERPLLSDVPNTGSAQFTVPFDVLPTQRARLMVFCGSQQFFALSPGDFRIR